MTKRTRYFVFASGTVLAAGLFAGLVAFYTAGVPAEAQASLPELHYVPADATVVAYANIREVMSSQLRERLRGLEPSDESRLRFQAETGIDLERDIDHVVGCVLPGERSGFVMMRGRFDAERLEALAERQGAEVSDHRGHRILELPDGAGAGDRASAFAFLEPGLVVLGDDPSVRRALDMSAPSESVVENEELMGLLRELDADYNAWAVGLPALLSGLNDLPAEVARQLPAIQRFAAAGRVNGGLSAVLRADTRDDEAAQNLRDVVRGFVALAKLQGNERPEWQAFLDSLVLGGTGSTVALSFQLPAEVLDLLRPPRNQVD